jgi:predicted ArsR family transcriptional regulator
VEAGVLRVNTVREHLRVLEDEGLVVGETVRTGGRGRPPVVFRPVRDADASPAVEERLAQARERGDLLRRLEPELDATEELGEDAVHQLDALYEHLEDAGLQPRIDEPSLTVGLVPCAYHAAVAENQSLVCSVHARLVQDVLTQVPGPIRLRRVDPFVTPHSCVVALGIAGRLRETGGDDAAASPGD